LLFKMIRAYLKAHNRYRRSVLLACIGGSAALLIHSIADFNLQIPANALLFAVVLGIGSQATHPTSASRDTRKEDVQTAGWATPGDGSAGGWDAGNA
jgi:hypothetical protein